MSKSSHFISSGHFQGMKAFNCVIIQASGSMTAEGLREGMMEASLTFAPADMYANYEGRIVYLGHIPSERLYNREDLGPYLFPMGGREDSYNAFILAGFTIDYDQVVLIDDGDTTLGAIALADELVEEYDLGKKVKGVIVRNYDEMPTGWLDRQKEYAEKKNVSVAFYDAASHRFV